MFCWSVFSFGVLVVLVGLVVVSVVRHNRRTRVIFKECKETKMIPAAWDEKRKSAHKRYKYQEWKDAIETYLGTDDCGDEVSVHDHSHTAMPYLPELSTNRREADASTIRHM